MVMRWNVGLSFFNINVGIISATACPDFQLWRVRAICKRGGQLPNKPAPTPKPNNPPRHNYCESLGRIERITGWVCVTNANIDRKHDERVFFNTKEDVSLPLTDDLVKDWDTLIRNYQEEHEDEIARGTEVPASSTAFALVAADRRN
ncbi:MAG: hypothetical protein KatS3mg110_0509 [Pirellulaceae bacterium]|nr:MAG: hypothetical protein KatS3mg110_0509 [Pirellulaceae bacterium]